MNQSGIRFSRSLGEAGQFEDELKYMYLEKRRGYPHPKLETEQDRYFTFQPLISTTGLATLNSLAR